MNDKSYDKSKALITIYGILSLIIVITVTVFTYGLDKASEKDIVDFGEGWVDDSGNKYEIEDVRINDDGTAPAVHKALPADLKDGDALCIESYNINMDVSVDGQIIYSFTSKENITGVGYGTAYHEVGLSETMAQKVVTINYKRCNPELKAKRAHIEEIYLGDTVSYIHMTVKNNYIALIASGLVMFFGILFVLISIVVSDNTRVPFDMTALGLASIITGAWLFVLTNVIQLITGHVYTIRVADRFLILLAGFPLICFFNSLTYKKHRIYQLIEFWSTILIMASLVIMRYFFGVDMMHSFQRLLIVYFIEIVILTVMIFAGHERYCRKNSIVSGLKYYYFGIGVFIICALTDLTLYFFKKMIGNSYGMMTSIGTFFFVPIVLIQFIKWWTKDRQVVERERFTNRSLQYALSSDSPDESIRLLLEFMGEEFGCKRVIVFEDMHNGKFNGRYAWFDKSLERKSVDLVYIPKIEVMDRIVNAYRENGNKYIIDDVEAIKDLNPIAYNMLKTYNIGSLVINPLEVDGEVTGLMMLIDMAHEIMEEASSVATLTSYFLSQLILRRDDQKRMRTYKYNDSLSGAQNRRAYDEFVSERLDLSKPFGYMMCRINDLEDISVNEGFGAGDNLIAKLVDIMSDVFGSENVYRLAGSSFVAFGFETDETYFGDDVARFEKNAKDNGINVSVGSVYCINGTMDIRTVVKRARDNIL